MSEHKERKTLEERQQMSDLERLRHSCAHVLATAICRLWPDAQLAGGPAVDNGFYYDVELDHRISTEDFERIEEEMKKVVKENQPFQKEVISRAEAMKITVPETGLPNGLKPGVPVMPVELFATPWARIFNGQLSDGIAYRAERLDLVGGAAPTADAA